MESFYGARNDHQGQGFLFQPANLLGEEMADLSDVVSLDFILLVNEYISVEAEIRSQSELYSYSDVRARHNNNNIYDHVPYTSDTCGRGFCESGHLRKHMRVHGADTPAGIDLKILKYTYCCKLCGLRRTRKRDHMVASFVGKHLQQEIK